MIHPSAVYGAQKDNTLNFAQELSAEFLFLLVVDTGAFRVYLLNKILFLEAVLLVIGKSNGLDAEYREKTVT